MSLYIDEPKLFIRYASQMLFKCLNHMLKTNQRVNTSAPEGESLNILEEPASVSTIPALSTDLD
jgi:hypothetical protein